MAEPDWKCPNCGKVTYKFLHSCPMAAEEPEPDWDEYTLQKWRDRKWSEKP